MSRNCPFKCKFTHNISAKLEKTDVYWVQIRLLMNRNKWIKTFAGTLYLTMEIGSKSHDKSAFIREISGNNFIRFKKAESLSTIVVYL